MIRVTVTCDLPDFWGADEQWEACNGDPSVMREFIWEDLSAFAEDATWKIEKLEAK